MSERLFKNGQERWLCHGTQIVSCAANGEGFDQTRISSSCESQSHRQRDLKFDVVQDKQRSQVVRASRFTRADLVRIEPINYIGKVWCVKVSTGAFIARRNGKIFVTGNSGFPKSHNISKGIDKKFGAEREVIGINEDYLRRKPNGMKTSGANSYNYSKVQQETNADITAPSTDLAKQWDGFGTALKPANEPIVLARKPLSEKTIVDNVLRWGTGGLNIDGCRIGTEKIKISNGDGFGTKGIYGKGVNSETKNTEHQGRFPANLILGHNPDCELLGEKKVKLNAS